MNFSIEMITRLNTDEQLVLRLLFEKAQAIRPTQLAPEWQWTMAGPGVTARKGAPSPRLKGDTAIDAARLLGAKASVEAHVSQVSSPVLRPLTLLE